VCPAKAGKDRHSMSKHTDKGLFMFSPLTKYAGFYQQLLKGTGSYQKLGNHLIQLAEQAHAFRQFDRVKETALILSSLPIRNYQAVGSYYLAVAFNRCGNGDIDKAKNMFELAADAAPPKYQAKAILSLAAVSAHKKDTDLELYYFLESLKASTDFGTSITALRGIAVHKSREGYHKHALNDLERTLPMIKHAPAHIYFDYLNALAVELVEAGRKGEARNIIKPVVASPFAFAYPEWQETAKEVKEPSRASISVPQIEHEPVEVEVKEAPHASAEAKPIKPGRVVSFPPLKEAPEPKRPGPLNPRELEGMTLADKREFILAAVRTELLSESEYDRFIYMLGLMNSGPASDVIDLEDKALLNDIIEVWCNMIDPDQFAAVMSALRDCKDDQRRESIMDDMISFAYQRTPSSRESESEWRRKVERRLPNK
jgi:tetratricopeptide (TPR) repeat protein